MELYVVDEIRTNNIASDCGDKIRELWKNSTNILKDYEDAIYVVYFDYEGAYLDDYSMAIATKNHITDNKIILPDLNYQMFSVDDSLENPIEEAWKNIWDLEEDEAINRAYEYDYEKYYSDGKVEIYISMQ